MIAGPSSNSGKTIITMGIIRAMRNRRLDVSAFKMGPDFIDRKFIAQASKKRAGNLDRHLMGQDGIKNALSMNEGQFAVIESVMGYFDGIHNTFEGSSYELSVDLKIPTVLVYSPKGEMFSVIPKIKGMVDFKDSQIKGIILNKVNLKTYRLLKEQIEYYLDLPVFGYLPYLDGINIEKTEGKEKSISKLAKNIEETIAINDVIKATENLQVVEYTYPKKRDIKVAIAYDEAFNHYYNENLKLFEKTTNVQYFSPLTDELLPESDFIYIGSGQLKNHLKKLSSNRKIIQAIQEEIKNGKAILAENAGFTYLTSFIDSYPMIDVFKANTKLQKRLNLKKFGYTQIQLKTNTLIGKKGDILKVNESHRSTVEINEPPIFKLRKIRTKKQWTGGYQYKNTLAYYQNVHFLGNIKQFYYLLDEIERIKGEDK